MGDAEVVAGLPIVASGVTLQRRGVRVLDDVDLTIEPRSRTFILGANGAGKSMLLRVLHGLIAPDTGRVAWGGDATRPARQAMVFQRPVLLRRSALGNIFQHRGHRGEEEEEEEERRQEKAKPPRSHFCLPLCPLCPLW